MRVIDRFLFYGHIQVKGAWWSINSMWSQGQLRVKVMRSCKVNQGQSHYWSNKFTNTRVWCRGYIFRDTPVFSEFALWESRYFFNLLHPEIRASSERGSLAVSGVTRTPLLLGLRPLGEWYRIPLRPCCTEQKLSLSARATVGGFLRVLRFAPPSKTFWKINVR